MVPLRPGARGAACLGGRHPSPEEALPLLGPCAKLIRRAPAWHGEPRAHGAQGWRLGGIVQEDVTVTAKGMS